MFKLEEMTAAERIAKEKKERLQLLQHHRRGCKFPMVEDLSEELTEYFDLIGITKVVSNIYKYFYDPSNRSEDPVAFLKSLVKGRRKDQRELHKAKRKWYRQLWKEWEIRDEIAKLRTLLGVLAPDIFTEDGDPKPRPDLVSASTDTLVEKLQDPTWIEISPKFGEHNQYAQLELQILKQHHIDQRVLMLEQQEQIEILQRKQQNDIQVLLIDFEKQLKNFKKGKKIYHARGDTLVPVIEDKIDTHLMQTQLGQMQTMQKNQIKSLQQTQYHEMLTQHNLHKHEKIQRLQGDGNKQQVGLHNMMVAHAQHEQLRGEHEDQIFDLLEEIQEQQQQTFDELLLLLTNRKFISLREPPEQVLKRTQQQLEQLHSKQKVQLLVLQEQEFKTLDRYHKISLRELRNQVKFEHQSLPRQLIQSNLIHHQETQIKKLCFINEETKELISLIHQAIENDLETREDDDFPPILERTRSEEVLNSISQVGALQERLVRLQQQMVQQELPYSTLPKISDEEINFRKIQKVILQQQRRLQQQFKQQLTLRSILEHLYELVTIQNIRVQGLHNPYRESQIQVLQDCTEVLKKSYDLCLKQRMRKFMLRDLELDVYKFHASYWKNRKILEEPTDNLGLSLLKGKLVKGNKKEMHPLQKILIENQNMQLNHFAHQKKIIEILKKAQGFNRSPIEQEAQLRKQQEKIMLQMLKDTEEIEEDQSEDLGPLDVQQYYIDGLTSIQTWMTAIINLQNILIEKCNEKGLTGLIVDPIECLENLYLQTHSGQDDNLKMVSARQEELVSHHQKIAKTLAPNQLTLTEEQLRCQKIQLNAVRSDLHNYFKEFTDPFKSNKTSIEEVNKPGELDCETIEILEILESNLVSLYQVLRDKKKQHKSRMQDIAQQVLKHQKIFLKLEYNHHHLLAQFEDLHIEPEKQILIDLMLLHKRLITCMKIQQQRMHLLIYRLRKSHRDSDEETKANEDADKDKLETTSERSYKIGGKKTRMSQVSMSSLSSSRKVTMTGVMKGPNSDKIVDEDASLIEPFKQVSETELKIRADTAEKKKSLSRISIIISEHDLTDDQRIVRERLRLISELKDKRASMLQHVQIHNKPDAFRRVQTLHHQRGPKAKKQDDLSAYVNEYREKLNSQSDFWPSKPMELSVIEENRKQLIKLFEKSEKLMLDKGEPPKGTTLLNMLSQLGVNDSASKLNLSNTSLVKSNKRRSFKEGNSKK